MAIRKNRFRPMGLGDVLDEAFDIYKNNFVLLIGISVLVNFPYRFITTMIGNVSTGALITNPSNQFPSIEQFTTVGVMMGIAGLLYLIAYPIVMCACTHAISQRYINKPTSIGESYKYVWQRKGPVFLTVLLLCLIYVGIGLIVAIPYVAAFKISLWFLVLAIPLSIAAVIATTVLWYRINLLCYTALVVEGVSGKDAIIRCWRLSDGHALRMFGYVFVTGLIISVIASMLQGGVLAVTIMLSGPGNEVLRNLVTGTLYGIIWTLIAPVSMIVAVLLYYDIRIRKEGFDLQMLAYELAVRNGNEADVPLPKPQATQQQHICAHCHHPIRVLEEGVMCPVCSAILHSSCWNALGGCNTPGCPAAGHKNTPAQ